MAQVMLTCRAFTPQIVIVPYYVYCQPNVGWHMKYKRLSTIVLLQNERKGQYGVLFWAIFLAKGVRLVDAKLDFISLGF